ncbi:MAG: efflux RND transporter periplasmic adaptor subunit [Caldilineaceae bacterium]
MRRTIIIIGVIAVLAVAGWWVYNSEYATAPENGTAQKGTGAEEDLANVIWASGKLQPLHWADLSTVSSGSIDQIHVAEGDWVEAGQVLIELDNGVLKSEVAVAEAAVAEAQAALDELLAPPLQAEKAAHEADLFGAQADLALAIGQLREANANVEAAQAGVRTAQREYSEMASHPTDPERIVAIADVNVAQAALKQAQAAYNDVRGDPKISARPEARAMYEATAALEAAKARAALVENGPTPQQLAVASSRIDAAQAEVNAIQSRMDGLEANVQSAMARVASAQSALDRLLAGAQVEEIAIAEARVQSAQAAVASANARLETSLVLAPFAGQVGAIHVRLGESITPGQPLLLVGDTSMMCVETTDLRETDVVHLHADMPVEVTFDALPNRVFQGTVTKIAPVSTSEKGSTNYTVQLDVQNLDAELRWGMTAFVNIQADRQLTYERPADSYAERH